MAWGRSTKQRRAMVRRRGLNGDHKRRFLLSAQRKIDSALRKLNQAAMLYYLHGVPPSHLARWLP